MSIKEEYSQLKKDFPSLPSFEKLDEEFQISRIEKDGFILLNVIDKIKDKIEELLDVVESVLQPDANSYTAVYECRCFNDTEHSVLYDIHKRLMVLYRGLMYASLSNDRKAQVEFIVEVMNEWPKAREEVLPFLVKLKSFWQKPVTKKEFLGYLV